MIRKCECGGNKKIMESRSVFSEYPNEYEWHCDKCEKHGKGWSFGNLGLGLAKHRKKVIVPEHEDDYVR